LVSNLVGGVEMAVVPDLALGFAIQRAESRRGYCCPIYYSHRAAGSLISAWVFVDSRASCVVALVVVLVHASGLAALAAA
jgi:hypothetical protein